MTCEKCKQVEHLPSPCPCCGAYSLAPDVSRTVLLAVCDALVIKALDKMGNFIVRAKRGRHAVIGEEPKYLAHTYWQPSDEIVSKALRDAWDVVPAVVDQHSCCGVTSGEIARVLDDYVHDLAITGTPHTFAELVRRFEVRLNFTLPTPA